MAGKAIFHDLLGDLKTLTPLPFHSNSESFFFSPRTLINKQLQNTKRRRTRYDTGTSSLDWKLKWWPCLSICVGFKVHSKRVAPEVKPSHWLHLVLEEPPSHKCGDSKCHTFIYCRVRPVLQTLFGSQPNPVVKLPQHQTYRSENSAISDGHRRDSTWSKVSHMLLVKSSEGSGFSNHFSKDRGSILNYSKGHNQIEIEGRKTNKQIQKKSITLIIQNQLGHFHCSPSHFGMNILSLISCSIILYPHLFFFSPFLYFFSLSFSSSCFLFMSPHLLCLSLLDWFPLCFIPSLP